MKMKESKPILIGASLILSATMVYGTALVVKLLKGYFLLEHGLFDIGYIFLTLVIVVPIILYILIAHGRYKKNTFEVITFSGIFTLILFVPVYLVSVAADVLDRLFLQNLIVILLITVVILVGTMHFAINNNSQKRKLTDFLS